MRFHLSSLVSVRVVIFLYFYMCILLSLYGSCVHIYVLHVPCKCRHHFSTAFFALIIYSHWFIGCSSLTRMYSAVWRLNHNIWRSSSLWDMSVLISVCDRFQLINQQRQIMLGNKGNEDSWSLQGAFVKSCFTVTKLKIFIVVLLWCMYN